MIILKKYKGSDNSVPKGWFETTEKECILHTELNGHWEKGTVLDMIKEGNTVWTSFAEYKKG